MMADDIASLVRARLVSHAGLAALVSDRVKPLVLPQGMELPAVTYELDGGGPINSGSGPTGTANRTCQVTTTAETYASAKEVAAQVEAALSGWEDESATPSLSPVLLTGERDDMSIVDDGTDVPAHQVVQDFSLWFAT
jgi:hypothetical protein